ncbi:MAG: hypothetical protein O7D94_09835 [Planctomycetota bacterium]|nr:hypothetical protein [Planctomycetota bacterium]
MTASADPKPKPTAQPPGAGKSRRRRVAPILIFAAVLTAWFGYLWFVSGTLDYEDRYPGGQIKTRGFVKRVGIFNYARHGEWVEYHENGGKSARGNYRAGEKVGDWMHWDPDGEIESRSNADDEKTTPNSDTHAGDP